MRAILTSSNLLASLVLFAGLLPLNAQQAPPSDAAGSPQVQFHGSVRSRLEMWDWFGATDASSYAYSGNIIRLSASRDSAHFNWRAEFAAPILLGLPEDAQEPGPRGQLGVGPTYYAANHRNRNAAMVFPKNLYLQFHHLGESQRHGVRLGRFEYVDGTELTPKNATLAALKRTRIFQRILGSFAWTHVGRSFDGVHYTYNAPESNVTLIGATPTRGVFQVDGWGWNQVAFAYGAYTRGFTASDNAAEIRLFGIYYDDFRDVVKTDNRPIAERRTDLGNLKIASFGAHAINAWETGSGTLDMMFWGVVQTGSWGRLSHRGSAWAGELGYQPKGLPALKPWLRVGAFQSSGDDDPTDGEHNTFFQLLPTPRPYARTPFYDMVNNEDYFATLTLRPHPRLTVTSEIHSLRLAAREDLWFLGGGVFQPWTFGYVGRPSFGGRGLATLMDVGAVVKITNSFSLEGYYGYANGKSVMRNIYPDDKNGSFGYLEAIYTF